ncbi:MAG: hypothetical protein MRZ79_26935 [Bacteroidia bacterium]|nr:hypothetical protein [Bacteroidia bacterium]
MLVLLLFLATSVSFFLWPEAFVRNVYTKPEYIQILGIIGIVLYVALLFSYGSLFGRKTAIIITNEFLVDHSKYESLGEIRWSEVSRIQKIHKSNVEVFLNKEAFDSRKISWFKRFLMFMSNWKHEKSVLISSALLECSRETLYRHLKKAHKDSQTK